ncbi:hypothetical protein [Prauserella muralis]|uniref:Uncharacterized protein n=1 Tax=Prauserella muralis TaxID=588067 RepID=A0A2V4B0K2_9PSEU|nr:hypothetical protein [Prauserella muralis]PXY27652.1 hypothetical protein BAY60_14715 [Prauserella muralis]TWE22613.1 hypothetical protein FHX69_3862 [Prauserella muralis]
MIRSLPKLATCAAVLALLAVPTTASAQESRAPVDERDGPVAYANIAALAIGPDHRGGSVISETQRSPLLPGTSTLAQSRALLPGTPGERDAAGPHYRLNLGTFAAGRSPFPAGVPSTPHAVTATLRDDTVPTATAKANYALRDLASDATVLAFQGAESTVTCAGPDRLTGETTADRLWLLDAGGELRPADLPAAGTRLTRLNLPFGPPGDVPDADPDRTVSDVVVSRITAYDQLLRQDRWRDGDHTTAAGWRVEIVTHVKDADGNDIRDVLTTLVLGGVSCSVPQGFTPVAQDRGRADVPTTTTPPVPVRIPAGAHPSAEPGPASAWGAGLLGGGLLLGAAAVLVAVVARRRPVASGGTD